MGISLSDVPYEPTAENTDRWIFALGDKLNGEHGGTLFEEGVAKRPVDTRALKKFIVSHGRNMLGAMRVTGTPLAIGDCKTLAPVAETLDESDLRHGIGGGERSAVHDPGRVQHAGDTQSLPEIDGKSPHGEAPGPQPVESHQAAQLEGPTGDPPLPEPERGNEALAADPGQEQKPEVDALVNEAAAERATHDRRPEPEHTPQTGGTVVEYEQGPTAVDGAPLEPDPQRPEQQPRHNEAPDPPARSSWRSPKGKHK